MNEEILRVTPDGEFIWHNNADKLIETGDFSGSPSAPHILRRLRRLSAVEAQRDALLEALKYHQEQTRPIQRTLDVIKWVEEGK